MLATLLLAVAIASSIMKLPGKTGAGATTAPGPATAAPAPRPTPGTPTTPPTDAPTGPLINPPPTDPADTGVLLILDEEMSDLLTYGEFDTVNTAANACGTSLAGMISAGGGLVVRLEDPSLNACLVTELAGTEHIVSAEEDMRVTVQD